MLINSKEDFTDDDGNNLHDDIMSFDWKEMRDESLEQIADKLDGFGIDVITYETHGDFFAVRFVKRAS